MDTVPTVLEPAPSTGPDPVHPGGAGPGAPGDVARGDAAAGGAAQGDAAGGGAGAPVTRSSEGGPATGQPASPATRRPDHLATRRPDHPSTGRPDHPTTDASAFRRRARRLLRVRELTWFTVLLGPNLALILAFTYLPLGMNMYYSTLDWRLGASTAKPVGLGNYWEFLTSPQGVDVWRVTLTFTVVTVLATMVFGLLMALVLNRNIPGRGLARTAVFAPYVLSGVGVGLVWNFVFDPGIGILAHVLRAVGRTSPQWFLDPDLNLVMVVIVYVWKNLGFAAVVFLAGLQSIPQDLLEAASLDGAGPVRRFFSVVLPLLGPTVFFLTVTTILNSMQAFDILRIMTPTGNGTNTMVFEIYLQSFGAYQRAGYAAAISVVLFVVLLCVTAVQMRFVERKVHYA